MKAAKGNSGRRPIGKDPAPVVAAATASKVSPPPWLKGEGLKVWQRLAPRVAGMKLLSQVDAETFGRYCANFARWLKMQKRLDKVGEIYEIETASGLVRRADPAFLIADRLDRKLESVEDRFGLNPAERQRIFAARAAAGASPDLFGGQAASKPEPDSKPADAKSDTGGKSKASVGFLN